MASGGYAAMGSTQVESKKEVVCGMCEQKCTARREYMKSTHGGSCVGCWVLVVGGGGNDRGANGDKGGEGGR